MADAWRLEDYSPDYKMQLGFCVKSENTNTWKMLLDNTKQRNWWFSSAEQKVEKTSFNPKINHCVLIEIIE